MVDKRVPNLRSDSLAMDAYGAALTMSYKCDNQSTVTHEFVGLTTASELGDPGSFSGSTGGLMGPL